MCRRLLLSLALVAVGLQTAACRDCPHAACDAVQKPARASIKQGFAGAVSYVDDVVREDNCLQCTYGSVTLAVWQVDPTTDEKTAGDAMQATPWTRWDLAEGYERALPEGRYLLCFPWTESCSLATVHPGAVTTLHFLTGGGAGIAFRVFEPGEETPADDQAFTPEAPPGRWDTLEHAFAK